MAENNQNQIQDLEEIKQSNPWIITFGWIRKSKKFRITMIFVLFLFVFLFIVSQVMAITEQQFELLRNQNFSGWHEGELLSRRYLYVDQVVNLPPGFSRDNRGWVIVTDVNAINAVNQNFPGLTVKESNGINYLYLPEGLTIKNDKVSLENNWGFNSQGELVGSIVFVDENGRVCLLYTSPSPRDS